MRRVLIIDDDAFYAGLVAKMFGQRRWLPKTCQSMEEALAEIQGLTIDLIVTDIFMPGIGGIDGIPFLKSKAPDIPIIAISGGWSELSPDDAVKAAVKVGAQGGIAKPVKAEALDKMLEGLGLGGSVMGEPHWPQTQDEVTDWDQVFDEPNNGLVAWISKAQSDDVLRLSAINMFAHLFQNTQTELDIQIYQKRLKTLFQSARFKSRADVLRAILGLLEEVKVEFKKENAKYVAEKRLEHFEQRRDIRQSLPDRDAAPPWHVKYRWPGLAAIGLLGVIGALSVFTADDQPEVGSAQTPRAAGQSGTGDGSGQSRAGGQAPLKMYDGSSGRPQRFKKPANTPADFPAILALQPVTWSRAPLNQNAETSLWLPLVFVQGWDNMAKVCQQAPIIRDLILTMISKEGGVAGEGAGVEADAIAARLRDAMTGTIDPSLVDRIAVLDMTKSQAIRPAGFGCRSLSVEEVAALQSGS